MNIRNACVLKHSPALNPKVEQVRAGQDGGPRLLANDSAATFDASKPVLSPMQRLLQRVEATMRLNDIDLPSVDASVIEQMRSGITSSNHTWAMATNNTMCNNLRELVVQ